VCFFHCLRNERENIFACTKINDENLKEVVEISIKLRCLILYYIMTVASCDKN
jgi:hypothetical protein